MIKLIIKIAYFFSIFAQAILSIRIVLTAINANVQNNLYAKWIMEKSNFLLIPFKGIVDSTINIWSLKIPSVLFVALIFFVMCGIVCSQLLKAYKNEG